MLIDKEQTYKILCEEYPLLQKGYLRKVIDKIPTAEVKGDLISKEDALNCVNKLYEGHTASNMFEALDAVAEYIEELPSAEPNILDDGTLTIIVQHGMLGKVNRVIVDEAGTKFCKMMYQDALPSAEPKGDLISKEDVLDEIHRCLEERDYTLGSLYDNVCEMPSAEPQIIRCKECKHWLTRNGGYCEIWEQYISNDAFYCGCGARMEGEEDVD